MQITLEDVVNISHVSALKEELAEALQAGDDIEIQAAGVNTIDAAALQLLAAFALEAQAQDKTIQWLEPSERFLGAVQVTGLQGALKLN